MYCGEDAEAPGTISPHSVGLIVLQFDADATLRVEPGFGAARYRICVRTNGNESAVEGTDGTTPIHVRMEKYDMLDPHLSTIRPVVPSADGCEDCLRIGSPWLHLRLCLTCGHVGCCDSSPNRHARRHFHTSGHPIVRSFEPGEYWRWCYVDEVEV